MCGEKIYTVTLTHNSMFIFFPEDQANQMPFVVKCHQINKGSLKRQPFAAICEVSRKKI